MLMGSIVSREVRTWSDACCCVEPCHEGECTELLRKRQAARKCIVWVDDKDRMLDAWQKVIKQDAQPP